VITPLTADSTRRTVDGVLRVSNTRTHVGSDRGSRRGPLRTTVTVKPPIKPTGE
jgi:hypothetical protein